MRAAIHRFLLAHNCADTVAVACSGGADSLALAAATVDCAAGLGGLAVHGLIVDHQLQPDSARVAHAAAQILRDLGCTHARVLPINAHGAGGPEAAARRARYGALRAAAPAGALVLLGHTLDDQAETVLLGLGRGSGPRSMAGMRELDLPWGRPLLGVRRTVTVAACAALGLHPWADPHNADPRFQRVRLRTEVLPLLEDVLAGGVAQALARTAEQLREDLDVLDDQARTVLAAAVSGTSSSGTSSSGTSSTDSGSEAHSGAAHATHRAQRRDTPGTQTRHTGGIGLELDVAVLAAVPAAVRRRVLRRWLLDAGVTELTDGHLRAADDLIGRWSGQGALRLPGGMDLVRAQGRLHVSR